MVSISPAVLRARPAAKTCVLLAAGLVATACSTASHAIVVGPSLPPPGPIADPLPDVLVSYNPAAFQFHAHKPVQAGLPLQQYSTINPSSVSVTPLSNGVELDFNGEMAVWQYTPLGPSGSNVLIGDWYAPFTLYTAADYEITDITVQYFGNYTLTLPTGPNAEYAQGMVAFMPTGYSNQGVVSWSDSSGSFGSPFQVPLNPSLSSQPVLLAGEIRAIGLPSSRGGDFVGYDPDTGQPVFSPFESLDVSAWIQVERIRITANIAPVPEPGTYALVLAGLALVGPAARRMRSRGQA